MMHFWDNPIYPPPLSAVLSTWTEPETCLDKVTWWHFQSTSKEVIWSKTFLNFMQGLKSAILAKMKNSQNGTFEPMHEIQKIFWPKAFFSSIMKMATWKNILNLSKGQPNPGFVQEKVQKGDFLKKPMWENPCFTLTRLDSISDPKFSSIWSDQT